MRILFHINHPAQYHLFKHTIQQLKNENHDVLIIARNKDVLTQLLNNDGVDFINTTHRTDRESNVFSLILNFAIQYKKVKKEIKSFKPDLLVGTSFTLPWISKNLKIPYLNFVEDDADVIPLYSRLSFPKSNYIVAPDVCNLNQWNKKKIGYNGYHELAFLHPSVFKPSEETARKYLNTNQKNYLIRLTAFNAHHDYGKNGIDNSTLSEVISLLSETGQIMISSEKPLGSHLEKYRLVINPNHIHHVMAYCDLIIGDSQSMAMEASCLGIPSLRMNDYADRISVLKELEEKYKLTHSFGVNEKYKFLDKMKFLIASDQSKYIYKERMFSMVNDKINVQEFLFWLISKFPNSAQLYSKDPTVKKKYSNQEINSTYYKLKKSRNKSFLLFFTLYFFLLTCLYLVPLEGDLKFNKYEVLSFRLDYILHLILFIPTVFIIAPIFLRQTQFRHFKIIGLSFILGVFYEFIHYFLSYRAFSTEDMCANLLGVSIGSLILLILKKHR